MVRRAPTARRPTPPTTGEWGQTPCPSIVGSGKRKPGPFPFPAPHDPTLTCSNSSAGLPAESGFPFFRPISCPFPCLVLFSGPLPYFSYLTPGSESRPCSTTPTTATWRMPFPTTSCDLLPVTGTTPGAGSASGGARGRSGSRNPVLGGWDCWGWWPHGLLTGSRIAPSQGEAAFPPVKANTTRIHSAFWKYGSRSGLKEPLDFSHKNNRHKLWGPGQISGVVGYDGKPPRSQKTQTLHFNKLANRPRRNCSSSRYETSELL